MSELQFEIPMATSDMQNAENVRDPDVFDPWLTGDGGSEAGKTFLIFVSGPNGRSREEMEPPADEPIVVTGVENEDGRDAAGS